MRLETVRDLTRDRDLAERHIQFLTAECQKLQEESPLSDETRLRLKETQSRLSDVKEYFAKLEPKLKAAIAALSQKIRELPNEKDSLILFEVYILLTPIRTAAKELHLNDTAAYNMHAKARDAYNTAQGIPLYKDGRGRKKWSDDD